MEIDIRIAFYLYSVLAVLTFIVGCDAACSSNDAIDWDPVRNESAYVTDPQSLNDYDGGRPLGFAHSVLQYIDNEDPILPCVTVTGCSGRRVEIMVETDPLAMICVEDVTTESPNPLCSERIYSCGQCPTGDGTVTYQFNCGQSCDQSSVNFWYRIVISDDPETLDPEEWCNRRNADQYPSSLIQNIPVVPPPVGTEPPAGRTSSVTASVLSIVLPVVFVWLGH